MSKYLGPIISFTPDDNPIQKQQEVIIEKIFEHQYAKEYYDKKKFSMDDYIRNLQETARQQGMRVRRMDIHDEMDLFNWIRPNTTKLTVFKRLFNKICNFLKK